MLNFNRSLDTDFPASVTKNAACGSLCPFSRWWRGV